MSEDPRDTQFLGFGKLLYEDFRQLARENTDDVFEQGYVDKWQRKVERLIAQRAYDLVGHVLECTNPTIYGYDHVPDMTEFPQREGH